MALLHRASMSPTKPELIAAWLPRQPWAAALPDLAAIGGYRIDDPGGAVGMEGILLRSADGAVVVHVVGEPIDGDAVLTGSWDGGSGVLAVLRSAGSR